MNDLSVNYTPATIDIVDRKEFENQINEVVKKYHGYEVTAETYKDDKKIRAELNNLSKSISGRRIEIKNEFNKPLSEFESWVKKATEPLTKVIEVIDKGVKEVEAAQKQLRDDIIRGTFKDMCQGSQIAPELIENNLATYSKASNFTALNEPKQGLLDELKIIFDREKERLEQELRERNTITNIAFDNNLPDTPYHSMLAQGYDINYIIEVIQKDVKVEREKKDAEEKARKAELDRQAKEYATRQLEKEMGLDELEVLENAENETKNIEIELSDNEKVAEVTKKPLKYQLWFEFADLEEKEFFKNELSKIGFNLVEGVFKK